MHLKTKVALLLLIFCGICYWVFAATNTKSKGPKVTAKVSCLFHLTLGHLY